MRKLFGLKEGEKWWQVIGAGLMVAAAPASLLLFEVYRYG